MNLAKTRIALLDGLSPRVFARVVPFMNIHSFELLAQTGHLRPLLDFFQIDYTNFNAKEIKKKQVGKVNKAISEEEQAERKMAVQVKKFGLDAELLGSFKVD
jgi:hypothetical protein